MNVYSDQQNKDELWRLFDKEWQELNFKIGQLLTARQNLEQAYEKRLAELTATEDEKG